MPNLTNQRIAALRAAMAAKGIAAYLIPSADPHSSEFLPAHYTACTWFSGFTGESATLAVTQSGSALWVDGRFFEQGEQQLSGTEISLMRAGQPGVPTPEEYLAEHLHSGDVLAFDGQCVSQSLALRLEAALQPAGARLQSEDLISAIWGSERPALPRSECWLLEPESAGMTIAEKLTQARGLLAEAGADTLAEGRLDCVAWLLNLRALDIECTPYALAFCLLGQAECRLYIDSSRMSAPVQAELRAAGVTLHDYADFYADCAALQAGTVLYDPAAANYTLCECLAHNPHITPLAASDPLLPCKGIRNAGELAATRQAHLHDGAAMVRFWIELERRMANGEPLTELDIDTMLHRARSAQPGFVVESFPTIAAFGPNASVIHYQPTPSRYSALQPRGLLLIDSGATYRTGTTDITRTYAMGALTREEKDCCTWVLQSHIELARAVWPDRCTGGELDTIARAPLWQHGLDFRHGTGHGVAHVGMVHEGPQSIRPHNAVVFQPGMVITDEPGVYEPGRVGVRIENELEVVKAEQTDYSQFLRFMPLTWVPYDVSCFDLSQLTAAQKAWLNWYHAETARRLAPLLTEEENRWLAEKTKPVV